MKPTRCCVQTQKGTRCANEPSPVRSTRMIGPVEIAACGLDGHQRAMRSLPDFVRHDAYCGAVGCDRPSNAGICPKHRDQYRDFGITEHALLAQEAPMTEPTLTPPAAPQDAADGGATPSLAAEPLHPLEARRASLIARLYMAGFAKVDGPAEHLWRFNGPNGAVLIPVGHPCEVERDLADMLDHAEKECAKVEAAAMPADAVEPSVGDVADAPLFVGGTDSAPMPPTAPGPTLAEVQAQLERERERANAAQEQVRLLTWSNEELRTLAAAASTVDPRRTAAEAEAKEERRRANNAELDAVQERERADEAKAELAAIAALLDPEDAPAYDSDDQPIPLPVRVQTALMPGESRRLRSLLAENRALWEIVNDTEWIVHHCGSYGATASLADRVLRLLPVERQRAILELKRSEAYIEVARLQARFLSPPPPGRLEEYAAKVAAIEAKIAALPSLPPSTTPLADDLRDLVGRIRCECPGEEAAAVCAELLTVVQTLARMEAR